MIEPAEEFLPPANRGNLSERYKAVLPAPTPLPTPIPVDPNATPLPAPTLPQGTGSVANAPIPVVLAPAEYAPGIGTMLWPFEGAVVQYFSTWHPAMDIAAPCGTPIIAGYGGEVVWSGWRDNGGGFVVSILTVDGLTLEYNHLSEVAVTGGYVVSGQVIGYVGMTGFATGCHVHLAVIENGWYTDALRFLGV